MRIRKSVFVAGVAGVALIASAAGALASHGKAGLWSVTVTMGGMSQMPDMSKMPPDVQARMKAMGMNMNGNSMTMQHCMTAQEVALDQPRMDAQSQKYCKMSNVSMMGHTMSADMTCNGEFNGSGHMQVTYDSDTHYMGEMTMNGMSRDGQPVHHDQKFEGRWLSADCGAINH